MNENNAMYVLYHTKYTVKTDSVRLSKTSFSWVNTLIIGVPTFAFITQLRTQLPVLLPMTSKLRYEIQGTTTDIANMPSTSVLTTFFFFHLSDANVSYCSVKKAFT